MSRIARLAFAATVAGIIAGITGFGLYTYFHGSPRDGDYAAAQMLPNDITLKNLSGQGEPFRQWHGRLLLINFWASWCGPCRSEIPMLINAQKIYGPRGFQIVGPAVDDPEAARRAAKKLGINYPVLISETPEKMIAFMNKLGNTPGGLPFSVLVGASGAIIERHLGDYDYAQLNALIRHHLPR